MNWSHAPAGWANRGRRWLAGLASGSLSLALLWAASRAEPRLPFPPLSLAERLIRETPGAAATFAIERLGHLALPLLAIVTTAVFAALAALLPAPPWLPRPRPLAAALALSLALAGAALAGPNPPAAPVALAAGAAGGLVYGVSLALLLELAASAGAETDRSRRRALTTIGSAALAVAVGGTLLGRLVERLAGPNTNVSIGRPDDPAGIPARPDFPRVPGLSPEVTSVSDHYVVDIDLQDPIVEVSGWTLAISGLVAAPLELDFEELQGRFPVAERHSVLTCVSNEVGGPLVGSSAWAGPRLRDVLAAARPVGAVVDVVFRCADGYTASIPLEAAMDESVLLAVAQNGRPLRWEHGFPCRVRAPGYYGIKNAKWLERIELVGRDQRTYWTERGWSDEGSVRTQSRIDVPRRAQRGHPTWIAGVAWAGLRGIERVEVSVDEGRSWKEATLRVPASPHAWTQWAYRWTPQRAGLHGIVCRATDGHGLVQDRRRRPPHPSGASGWHTLEVDVT